MDFLDFSGEDMYFDEPISPIVEGLLLDAAQHYGTDRAEASLLRAYFIAPEQLTVLVALYRYDYYHQRYQDALITAERAIAIVSTRLNLTSCWQDLSAADLGRSALVSMTLTRFMLLAIKGAGYLLMRLGDHQGALARFEKIAEIDTSDRLGITELLAMARAAVAEAAVRRVGGNVRFMNQRFREDDPWSQS
jgi:tetratricopeptide (TPR) repeat protein